ncbi:universal stress protein, partial [Streptomyces sp. NRRL WC-3549]|uniref:universal stress protein n=1 Tax=Streptomyces sp. NRRL WC-3549 TaxID=1463925 RepID=UPI00131AA11F
PVLAGGHRLLARAERATGDGAPVGPSLVAVGRTAEPGSRPVVVAVGGHDRAVAVVGAAARLARGTGSPLEVVHVRQTAVVEGQAVDAETDDQARAAVTAHLDRLAAEGLSATGRVLTGVGDHADAGRALARHATEIGARAVAVGRSPRGALLQFADGSFTTALTHAADCTVVLVEADDTSRHLTAETLAELRGGTL